MKKIILFILLVSSFTLFAQKGALKATLHTTATYMHEIPALSKMDNIIAAKGFEDVAPPKRKGKNTFISGKGLPLGEDPLVKQQAAIQTKAGRAPITSFIAHQGTVLNDPTGAIGPNHYVYAFNSGFGILDRSGNVLSSEASLSTLFPNETLGDPVVVYDNFADRFIIMEFSNSPNGFLVAVCKGPNPVNDGWYTYRFNTGSFPDYEKLSIWQDGYYITANKDQSSSTTSEVVFALERDKMLTGDTNAQMIGFPLPNSNNNGFYSPGGFNAVGTSLPPAGTGHPIVYLQDDSWSGVSQDHLKIWTTTVDWTTPSNSSISSPQSLNTTSFDSVFDGGNFQNLDEPGSGPDIDALQATMMFMTNYRRFASHNSVVMNFVVDVSGNDTVAGIRWFELRQSGDGQPWSIYQEGTYSQPDGYSAFSGSINIDSQGNIGLGYTIVSSSVYTSLRYTGRLVNDPVGTMTLSEQSIVDGNQKTNRSDGRYGDYAQLTIDPVDDLTFWHIGEYMQGSSSTVRKSHVAAFKLGTSGGSDTEAPSTPTNLSASGTTQTTTNLSWSASTDNEGVTGYDIFKNGNLEGSSSSTSYTVSGLTASTTYSFYVKAKDAAGNISSSSNTVSVTTDSGGSSNCAEQDLTLSITFDNYPQETSWTLKDASGTTVASKSYSTSNPDGSTVVENINGLVAGDYTFTIKDSYGDGICCQYGSGSYTLSSSVGTIVTGGEFTSSEATDFCVATGNGSNDCAAADLSLSITFDNYPQETAWTLKNTSGTTVASESYSTSNPDGSTIVENINNLASGDYTFTMTDSYGDGICCQYGSGSYTLSSSEGTIVSGGEFTSSDATDFCVDATKQRIVTHQLNDSDMEFNIYPNPVQTVLNVSSERKLIDEVRVFSAYGSLVKQIKNVGKGTQIDFSQFNPGTYFIRFVSGETIVTKKFIKK